jgi:p-hydroxybenzoate 3-monooxygenase
MRFNRREHRINLYELTGGKAITIYAQQEVVKDLVNARLAAGGQIFFEAKDVSIDGFNGTTPSIRFSADGKIQELSCDFIAGCDGFHGVCRPSIPAGVLTFFDRTYPFAWLGILVQAPPSSDELIYAHSERGFALLSMRSTEIGRLYMQVPPDADLKDYPDDRVWRELHARFAIDGDWKLTEGPVLQKNLAPMRSFVAEPMQYGRLYLAGDAAHIVPATGAKGLNLAAADVRLLSQAFADYYSSGGTRLLEEYSQRCLRRVWKAQRFSWWMTTMLHRFDTDTAFDQRRQVAELDYLTGSRAAMTSLAENYVGLPWD